MIIQNQTAAPVSLIELGITVPAAGEYDLRYKSKESISYSTELRSYIANGYLTILNETNGTSWGVNDALKLVEYGTNPTLLGVTDTYPGVVPGRLYSARSASSLTLQVIKTGAIYAIPLAYPQSSWNRIGVEVSTSVANSSIRVGIYANVDGAPGPLLLDAGTVSGATIGLKEIIIDYTNATEWFWLACTVSHDIAMRAVSGAGTTFLGRTSTTDTGIRQVQATMEYGPLPTQFPASEPYDSCPPYIWVKTV